MVWIAFLFNYPYIHGYFPIHILIVVNFGPLANILCLLPIRIISQIDFLSHGMPLEFKHFTKCVFTGVQYSDCLKIFNNNL